MHYPVNETGVGTTVSRTSADADLSPKTHLQSWNLSVQDTSADDEEIKLILRVNQTLQEISGAIAPTILEDHLTSHSPQAHRNVFTNSHSRPTPHELPSNGPPH